MAGLPSNKYDLLPYSTVFSSPSSTPSNFNYTHHRLSKREYIESSDVEDTPSSAPRKYRGRKRREWRDSSDLGYSSDVDEDSVRRVFVDPEPIHRRRTITVAGCERIEDIMSSQTSQESSTSKFQRILVNAITDGLDSLDFSECGLLELPSDIGELKHLVRSSALQHKAPLIPQLKVFLGTGNHLTSLPYELFTLSNLTVLSLWNNDLKYIPGAIGNLVSLRELNLAGNQLSFLPHTLFDLKHLQHLRLHPNPFLAPPDSYAPLPTPPSSQVNIPAILRASQFPSRPSNTSLVPSLVEFASRVLASNFILADIDKAYELPEYLRDKALHAEDRHLWHDTCAVCGTWYVDGPVDENGLGFIEWYDTFYGNDAAPIYRGLCSWGCVEQWKKQCDDTLGESVKDASEE